MCVCTEETTAGCWFRFWGGSAAPPLVAPAFPPRPQLRPSPQRRCRRPRLAGACGGGRGPSAALTVPLPGLRRLVAPPLPACRAAGLNRGRKAVRLPAGGSPGGLGPRGAGVRRDPAPGRAGAGQGGRRGPPAAFSPPLPSRRRRAGPGRPWAPGKSNGLNGVVPGLA